VKIEYVPQKQWYLPTSPHGITTQKTNINILNTMRTSNLIKLSEILVSHSSEYEEDALMMEAISTFETSVNFYKKTVIFILTAVRTSNPTSTRLHSATSKKTVIFLHKITFMAHTVT
jgi:hypothetical protein